ncbi:DNA primase [Desulfomicrobium sp. ZS1]|jgi:DNA primase|uniref:DNA primase n=1 Tax=Desulfomicrobium sp. ZS1 TaxID=2952228 RepID=UPI0020B3939A|nr:DNA primase [Desulfomicrobium sp. ZS1]UTF50419.1 DNA primase [Desulfomicrobium sp. ZS1]
MSTFDQGLIAQIKARLRIEDVIGRHVELRPVGNRLVAPCPFHQETKPSFSVNPEGGFYYCFGCQASGDIIEFYRAINGLEFGEAVEALAREAGLEVRKRPEYMAPGEISRSQCLDMHALAAVFYREVLGRAPGQAARDYIARRGLAPEIVERFCLGWAPAGWNELRDHLRGRGFSEVVAEKAGLVSKSAKGSYYDRFRERLIFPIMNLSAQTVAFGGRSLVDGDGPKYLNSSETPIYTKGEHLYGLYQARRAMSHSKSVLLTEGYVDVLSLHQFGFENSCGVLGTALTPEQVHRLSGLVGQVDLVFDGDNAGRKAALRSAEMILTQGLKCRVLLMPEGEDVDSVLQKNGRESLLELSAQAVDGLDYCLRQLSANQSPKDVLNWATGFMSRLKKLDWKSYYLPKLAAGLGLSETELRRTLGEKGADAIASAPARLEQCKPSQLDKNLLAFAVRFPEYHGQLHELGLGEALATERGRIFWSKIFGVSPHEVLSRMDQGEKQFYVQCQMRTDVTVDDGRSEWDEVQDFLRQTGQRRDLESLNSGLRKARQSGDFQEELRLLALIQAKTQC